MIVHLVTSVRDCCSVRSGYDVLCYVRWWRSCVASGASGVTPTIMASWGGYAARPTRWPSPWTTWAPPTGTVTQPRRPKQLPNMRRSERKSIAFIVSHLRTCSTHPHTLSERINGRTSRQKASKQNSYVVQTHWRLVFKVCSPYLPLSSYLIICPCPLTLPFFPFPLRLSSSVTVKLVFKRTNEWTSKFGTMLTLQII